MEFFGTNMTFVYRAQCDEFLVNSNVESHEKPDEKSAGEERCRLWYIRPIRSMRGEFEAVLLSIEEFEEICGSS